MNRSAPTSLLTDLPDSVLWSGKSWPDHARRALPERHLALLPVFGFADWGLSRSIDLEEVVGCAVLRSMLAADERRARALSILPPLRFVLGPYPHSVFGIDYETALDLVREIATSICAAGVRRLVFFNTSPWNEEFMETCAVDLRADLGLQTFVIHLEALGLDLHPTRSSTRTAVQLAACALTRRAPAGDSPRADLRMVDFRPGEHRQPPPLPWTRSLDASVKEGWTVLADAGTRLASLLEAVDVHPPLAFDGAIPVQRSTGSEPSADSARPHRRSRASTRPAP